MVLHNQGQDKFVYTCNNCNSHVETRYHCTVCDDFDLCVPCYDKEGHPHKIEKLGIDLDVSSSPGDTKQPNPQDEHNLSMQRCIQSLIHACQCRDANCRVPSCQKMKRVVAHTRICKRKIKGECVICNQVIALWFYHAEQCQETKCAVPFCNISIKQKLKQRQLQHRVQQQQLLRRRMAAMNIRCGATHAQHAPSTIKQRVGTPQQQQQQLMHQKALQQLMAMLRSPANHNPQQEIMQILKSNPPLMAAFIKKRAQNAENQYQRRLQQMHQVLTQQTQVGGMSGVGGVGGVSSVGLGGVGGDGGVSDMSAGAIGDWFKQGGPASSVSGVDGGVGGVGGGVGGVLQRSPPATPRPPTPSELVMMRESPAPAPHETTDE